MQILKSLLIAALITVTATPQVVELSKNVNYRLNQSPYEYGPLAIADGVTMLEIMALRNAWPDTGSDLFKLEVFTSVNGGPFELNAAFTAQGGVVFERDGVTVKTHTRIRCPLIAGTNRQIAAVLTVYSNFQTSVSVNLYN